MKYFKYTILLFLLLSQEAWSNKVDLIGAQKYAVSFEAEDVNCDDIDYQTLKFDYGDDRCIDLITRTMEDKSCSKEQIYSVRQKFGDVIELRDGSSRFCNLETENGVYQVMTSSMSNPPMAVIFYSRWD